MAKIVYTYTYMFSLYGNSWVESVRGISLEYRNSPYINKTSDTQLFIPSYTTRTSLNKHCLQHYKTQFLEVF